jgi:hypothetical protein
MLRFSISSSIFFVNKTTLPELLNLFYNCIRCTVPECDGMIKCEKKISSREELWLHGRARTTA